MRSTLYEPHQARGDGTGHMAVMAHAAARYSWDNKFALFRTLLDGVVDQSVSEVSGRAYVGDATDLQKHTPI